MTKILVHFYESCGRMGDIECLFVTTQEQLDKAKGFDIMLGEVLGKHSEVSVTMDDDNTRVVSADQEFIDKLLAIELPKDWGRKVPMIPIGWDLVECAEGQKAEETDPDDEEED